MNEARRFVRYLFPGMMFVFLLSLYLFLSEGDDFLFAVSRAVKGTTNGGGVLQASVFILFVSGAGYFFATIYHSITKIDRLRLPNHSASLTDARINRWVQVKDRSRPDQAALERRFSSSEAWSIMSAYYHVRIHKDEFKNAHNRIESLNDTLHGLGASWVAAAFAFFIWVPVHRSISTRASDCYSYWLSASVCVLAFFVTSLMVLNWWSTGKEAQDFMEGVAAEFMAEESRREAITLYFPE